MGGSAFSERADPSTIQEIREPFGVGFNGKLFCTLRNIPSMATMTTEKTIDNVGI